MEYSSAEIADILSLGLNADAEAVIAVDTEYLGTHTLTVQAAGRIDGETLAVQVYRSSTVPDLPAGLEVENYLPAEKYRQFFSNVVVRPVRLLSPGLSPMRMVADLFGIGGIDILARAAGRRFLASLNTPYEPGPRKAPDNVLWQPRRKRWKLPPPARFWHESPGMLRDVDMGGAYPAVASRISLYAGRPVILEPGEGGMSLAQAVELLSRWAPRDGWLVRASGPVEGFLNTLVPSPDDAVTSLNYREAMRQGRRRASRRRAFHLERLRDPSSVKGTVGTRLYSSAVEAGVVTWATWQAIQALPTHARRQYERLKADALVFYPSKLIAEAGREFDALVEQYRTDGLLWEERLDLDAMELVRRERVDHRFVSLRVPLGEYAARIAAFRQEAQAREGKGSGADLSWKVYGNTLYGVLASGFHPCNNFVAANVITAWARAEAFVMAMSLNAIQTITDGCTFRADRVPSGTFEECLRTRADYPVRRAGAGDGVAFLPASEVPVDDAAFTEWYRGHARRFFGEAGPGFSELIGAHDLVHKKTTGTNLPTFDALACDGAGNYAKVGTGPDGSRRVTDFLARSFRLDSKATIQKWLVDSYSDDRLEGPSPLGKDRDLMSHGRAGQVARKALEAGVGEVVFPLGHAEERTRNYKALKPSAFVFGTPGQRAAVVKQVRKFEERTGCGLEVLALRRSYGSRRKGSLADLAAAIHGLVRSGGDNLASALNLNRLPVELKEIARKRLDDLGSRRRAAWRSLLEEIDAGRHDPDTLATALVLTPEHLGMVGGRPPSMALAGSRPAR